MQIQCLIHVRPTSQFLVSILSYPHPLSEYCASSTCSDELLEPVRVAVSLGHRGLSVISLRIHGQRIFLYSVVLVINQHFLHFFCSFLRDFGLNFHLIFMIRSVVKFIVHQLILIFRRDSFLMGIIGSKDRHNNRILVDLIDLIDDTHLMLLLPLNDNFEPLISFHR